MTRTAISLILAVATLACAAPLATSADAQERRSEREREGQRSEQQRPRVSPDEARRSASQDGRPIDIQPRRDGNYGVLVERGGQVREVVVDGQTGQRRQNSNEQRPRRPD